MAEQRRLPGMLKTVKPRSDHGTPDGVAGRKRRRAVRRPQAYDPMSTAEELALRDALHRSKHQVRRTRPQLHEGPVFRPTLEEFRDPLAFIRSIRDEAAPHGICKVIPPEGWSPPPPNLRQDKEFRTRIQLTHRLQEGRRFEEGKAANRADYQARAAAVKRDWEAKHNGGKPMTEARVEEEFWDLVETGTREAVAHYANDLDTLEHGSGFPPRSIVPGDWSEAADGRADGHSLRDPAFYAKTGWNLNNLPFLRHSVTGHVQELVQGVNVPWLYYGMLFASFAWHTEDNFLYSINYMHFGAPKSWYGVGSPQAAAFERAVRRNAPASFRDTPDLLFAMVALHPPAALCGPDVDVSHCIQRPGEFVVTFPEGYHGGFSHGFNCNEAVNFGLMDWLPFGRRCTENYRMYERPSVLSHEAVAAAAAAKARTISDPYHLACIAAELYEAWHEEVKLHGELRGFGLHQVERHKDAPLGRIRDETARACAACEHVCYLSGVTCPCTTKVACARHQHELCSCPIQNRRLLVWHSADEVAQLHAKVLLRLQQVLAADAAAAKALRAVQAQRPRKPEQEGSLVTPPVPKRALLPLPLSGHAHPAPQQQVDATVLAPLSTMPLSTAAAVSTPTATAGAGGAPPPVMHTPLSSSPITIRIPAAARSVPVQEAPLRRCDACGCSLGASVRGMRCAPCIECLGPGDVPM